MGQCPPHIAIIDDICTTGSTLAALAAPLKAQGAMRIEAWCIATSMPKRPNSAFERAVSA